MKGNRVEWVSGGVYSQSREGRFGYLSFVHWMEDGGKRWRVRVMWALKCYFWGLIRLVERERLINRYLEHRI